MPSSRISEFQSAGPVSLTITLFSWQQPSINTTHENLHPKYRVAIVMGHHYHVSLQLKFYLTALCEVDVVWVWLLFFLLPAGRMGMGSCHACRGTWMRFCPGIWMGFCLGTWMAGTWISNMEGYSRQKPWEMSRLLPRHMPGQMPGQKWKGVGYTRKWVWSGCGMGVTSMFCPGNCLGRMRMGSCPGWGFAQAHGWQTHGFCLGTGMGFCLGTWMGFCLGTHICLDGVLPGHMDRVLPGHMDGVLPGHMDGRGFAWAHGWPGFCPGTWMGFCLGTWMRFCLGTWMGFCLGISMGIWMGVCPGMEKMLHPCEGKTHRS